MYYIAHVHLDGFYVQALGLTGLAVVHHEDRVLDLTEEAVEIGITRGMELAEARSILDGRGQVLVVEPSAFFTSQDAWLEIAAVFSDIIEPLSPHEALVDLSAHPRPADILSRMVRRIERHSKCRVRAGAARNRWIARLSSALGDPQGQALFCPAPLPTEMMFEIPLEHRRRLFALGYRKIGEVAELDLAILQKQFSHAAYAIQLAARGQGDAHVRPEFPRDALASHIRFEGAPDDWQTLQAGLMKAADQLGSALMERHLSGNLLEVVLEFEDGGIRLLKRRFTKPLTNGLTVVCGARLLLSRFPEHPVTCLRLRTPGLKPAKHAQLGFDGLKSKHERERNALVAVQSLCQVFGDHAIELATERPVLRRRQVLSAWSELNGWR